MFMLRKTFFYALLVVVTMTVTASVAFAAEEQPVTAPEQPALQHFFVGLQPHHKLHVQRYLIDALHFAHNSFGYVAWSMRASRRNLQETLYEQHLQQLDHFITQTVGLAELSMNLAPNPEGLPEIKAQLDKLGSAVKLMLEENKGRTDGAEPGSKIQESGRLHEEVGKSISELSAALHKSLQEHASATSDIKSDN
jgi:hypothetical protein